MDLLKNIKIEELELNDIELEEELEKLEDELSGCGILCSGDHGGN